MRLHPNLKWLQPEVKRLQKQYWFDKAPTHSEKAPKSNTWVDLALAWNKKAPKLDWLGSNQICTSTISFKCSKKCYVSWLGIIAWNEKAPELVLIRLQQYLMQLQAGFRSHIILLQLRLQGLSKKKKNWLPALTLAPVPAPSSSKLHSSRKLGKLEISQKFLKNNLKRFFNTFNFEKALHFINIS